MVAIVGGLICLAIGAASWRSYTKHLDAGTLPSPYDVRRVRLLSLWFTFPVLGVIAIFAGIVQLVT